MEKIDEQLNNLTTAEVPILWHQTVMRKVHYQKIKPVLFFALAFLVVNFLLVAWHINAKLIEADFTDMVQDFFGVFNFNFAFFSTMLVNFFEIISPALFLYALVSLAGSIYVGKKISFYHFS